MCHQCNYPQILAGAALEATANRLHVLEVVGNNRFPLSADDIYKTLERRSSINRVTVYRILDLLVDHGIVERLSTGGRAAYSALRQMTTIGPTRTSTAKAAGKWIV